MGVCDCRAWLEVRFDSGVQRQRDCYLSSLYQIQSMDQRTECIGIVKYLAEENGCSGELDVKTRATAGSRSDDPNIDFTSCNFNIHTHMNCPFSCHTNIEVS